MAMRFQLRKTFTKTFKDQLWNLQFGAETTGIDAYGVEVTQKCASIDHIIPLAFFNKNLAREIANGEPIQIYYRYVQAANSVYNLQYLNKTTNKKVGAKTYDKCSRYNRAHVKEMIPFLNKTFNINLQ